MLVRLLDHAERDLEAGFRFYETQQTGLWDYFLDSVSAELESLALFAGIHREVYGCLRLLVHRFPYAIYYTIENGEAWVWAVVDCRRNPNWIARRLLGSGLRKKHQ